MCWLIRTRVTAPRPPNPQAGPDSAASGHSDSFSLLLQTHHGSSWSPRPCMDPVTTMPTFPSTCLPAVLGGCQIYSYLSALAPVMPTGQAALPSPPLRLSGISLWAITSSFLLLALLPVLTPVPSFYYFPLRPRVSGSLYKPQVILL